MSHLLNSAQQAFHQFLDHDRDRKPWVDGAAYGRASPFSGSIVDEPVVAGIGELVDPPFWSMAVIWKWPDPRRHSPFAATGMNGMFLREEGCWFYGGEDQHAP